MTVSISQVAVPAAESRSDHVELLSAMSRDFADSRDIEQTLRMGLMRITDYLEAAGGALFLLDEQGTTLTCTCCVGATDIEGLVLPSHQGIVGRSVQKNSGELVRDVARDPAFFKGVDEKTGFRTRSIICAPMSVRDECIGAIELVNKRASDPRFTSDDLHVLETMASAAALAILNAHMAEALVEQERVRRELELAAEIQRSLLPEAHGEDFPVHGVNLPAYSVSGDFYDFFALADGRICFNLGDVSGKGMNAALLMAKTASLYRCLGKTGMTPARLMARINNELCETNTRGMFVTMVGGIYDPATGRVCLVNAGHEPPLIHGPGEDFRELRADSIPVGIMAAADDGDSYPETTVELDGRALYVFTDGVTEGFVRNGEMLGSDGLRALLAGMDAVSPPRRLDGVISLFKQTGQPLRDDVTLLVIDDSGPAARRATGGAHVNAAAAGTKGDCEELVRLTIQARPDRLRLVRQAVSLAAASSGCDDAAAADLMLAVDEACQNVIRHAYQFDPNGRIIVTVQREGDSIIVLIRDFAPPIDVASVQPRDLDELRPGGLGTHLIREVLDGVEFLPTPLEGGNVLKLTKKIGALAP